MLTTNIFYRVPSRKDLRTVSISGGPECTLKQFYDHVAEREGLDLSKFLLAFKTRLIRADSCNLDQFTLTNNSHVHILIPVQGGKGGFGSLLRAIGAQIEKTTNRDACRDLSGCRLRDIKREDELKKLLALQEKLQEERARKKKEKLEKLKKRVQESADESKSIQELVTMFEDHEYNRRRHELGDILEAAVEKGLLNFKKRKQNDFEQEPVHKTLRVAEKKDDMPKSTSSDQLDSVSNLSHVEPKNTKRLDDLWLGVDESEEESDEEQSTKAIN